MKSKKLYFNSLLILLVSSSIYRIDFAFGLLFFKLTPSLFFSFLLFFLFLIDISKDLTLKIKRHKHLLLYIGLLCSTILFSLFVNSLERTIDPLQLARFVLFLFIIIIAFIFVYFFDKMQKINQLKLLSKFIDLSLTIYMFFSIMEIYYFLQGKFYLLEENPFLYGFISPFPQSIGPYFPRLTGGFIDPNIASYFLVFLFFLSCYLNKTKAKFLSFFLLVLTLSRSGIGGFIVGFFFYKTISFLLKEQIFKTKYLNIFKKLGFFACFFACFLIFIYLIRNFATGITNIISVIISIRFGSDLQAGSGKIHMQLIIYALEKLNSLLHFVVGYGFNSSYIFAQKFFPGNKYANFHSEYITFLFEEGILGLLAYLTIYFLAFYYGLFKESLCKNKLPLLCCLIAFMVFNIFYQQFIFLYYWVALFLIIYLLRIRNGNYGYSGILR